MPEKWLQIKGDPSVKDFLLQQTGVESLSDSDIQRIHDVVHQMLTTNGVF